MALKVNLVTPAGAITRTETDAVTAPGEMGEFEVLEGHIPFLTAMHAGVLTLGETREREIYAVGNGYLRVNHEGEVEILVEQALAAADVEAEAAADELRETETALDAWKKEENAEFKNLKARHDWARARVDASAAARGH